VKPSNVKHVGDRVVLFDFGIAHDARLADLTATGAFVGTLGYAADWVLTGGIRLGFQIDFGPASGGTAHYPCPSYSKTCTAGSDVASSREKGTGLFAAFVLGWGLPPKRAR
jgi:serine/threonine protein kinase